MKAARRFCFRLGIPLYDLLSGNAAQTTIPLDFKRYCPLPPSMLSTPKATSHNHKEVLSKIHSAYKNENPPLSLKGLAGKLGVSIGYLEYRFPDMVRHIVDKYQNHINKQQLEKRYLAQKFALKYFIDEAYDQFPKSRKNAYRVLREETGLPKFMLKNAIQAAYGALN